MVVLLSFLSSLGGGGGIIMAPDGFEGVDMVTNQLMMTMMMK